MIFAIKPFEIHDGEGIRTTIFFKGCPLRCQWCHNPESFSFEKDLYFDPMLCRDCMRCVAVCDANEARDRKHIFSREHCDMCESCQSVCPQKAFEIIGAKRTAEDIAAEALRDEIFMKGSGGGVTFSGGEPLMQVDLCVEIAKLLKIRDIHVAIDTCGAVPTQTIDKIAPYADAFLFDVKAIDEGVHKKCTGVSNKQILKNLEYIDTLDIPIEIRYPYVPTMNDGEVESISNFLKKLKNVNCVRVLGYHNYGMTKYDNLGKVYPLADIPVPSREELINVTERMKTIGVKNVLIY